MKRKYMVAFVVVTSFNLKFQFVDVEIRFFDF